MTTRSDQSPKWMRYVLFAAAIYNLAWGAWVVIFPNAYFDLAGMERPLYPEIWQCVGMIVGVYGVGYAIAGLNPFRHWPIVLVGLLGKFLGPIGFVKALIFDQAFTWKAGLNIITNDLIWWIPFTLILLAALRKEVSKPYLNDQSTPLNNALEDTQLATGESLAEASSKQPVLLCFLRHYG